MATRSTAEEWRHGVACVMGAGENEHVVGNLLDNLNAFVYPLDGLQDKVCVSVEPFPTMYLACMYM